MINPEEFQLAAEILSFVEDIPDIDEGKHFINLYIALTNRRMIKEEFNPLERNAVLKFIVQVDPRFGNMV